MQAPGPNLVPPRRRGLPGWAWAAIGCGLLALLIGPVAIIAAILFPVFAQAREKARAAGCVSNIKQLAVAVGMYAQDYDGRLPLARNWGDGASVYAKSRR